MPFLYPDYIIIALMYAFTSGVSLQLVGITIGLFGSLAAMCAGYVPMIVMEQLQALTIVIFAASKIPQAYSNWKTKSTGKLALFTFLLNFAGSVAHIFTTLQEVNDPIGASLTPLANDLDDPPSSRFLTLIPDSVPI
jgi:hypothetical protein